MSIIQWNCRGIQSSSAELKTIFREVDAKVACLQETKLGNKPYNPGLNYNFYQSPPLPGDRSHGGTAIIIDKSVKCNHIQLDTDLQACAVRFI